MATAYVNLKKACVLVRHKGLEIWEVSFFTVKGRVNKKVAPAVSFEEHKAKALTDMRRKGRTDIPASNWNRAKYNPKVYGSWNEMLEGIFRSLSAA